MQHLTTPRSAKFLLALTYLSAIVTLIGAVIGLENGGAPLWQVVMLGGLALALSTVSLGVMTLVMFVYVLVRDVHKASQPDKHCKCEEAASSAESQPDRISAG